MMGYVLKMCNIVKLKYKIKMIHPFCYRMFWNVRKAVLFPYVALTVLRLAHISNTSAEAVGYASRDNVLHVCPDEAEAMFQLVLTSFFNI